MINEIDVRGRAVGRVSLIVDGPHKAWKIAARKRILDRHTRTRAGDIIEKQFVVYEELILGDAGFALRGTPLEGDHRPIDQMTMIIRTFGEIVEHGRRDDRSDGECGAGTGEHPAVAFHRPDEPCMQRVPCCRRLLLIIDGGLD